MRPFSTSRGGRPATVTIIVISFLLVFFILGLTFAFYSIAESDQTKVFRDSVNVGTGGSYDSGPEPDPESLYNQLLADIIYGPPDGYAGAFNVLRGHDLSRLVYGWDPANPTAAVQPFNGIGLTSTYTRYPFLSAAVPNQGDSNGQPSVRQQVNYVWAPNVPGLGGMMFEIDSNNYRNPALPPTNPGYRNPPDPTWVYRHYAKNANYTYPDPNNIFLGVIHPYTGQVMVQSYHRRWLAEDPNKVFPDPNYPKDLPPVNPNVGPVGGSSDPAGPLPIAPNAGNTNPWTNAWGRLAILRPRPVDHQFAPGQSHFPYPTIQVDPTDPNNVQKITYGDVENLAGKPGGPRLDSLWMDIDAPVKKWNGKNYKALVALLVVDLDGRININTAGNFFPLPDSRQPAPPAPLQYEHVSNHGFGSWEVNPARVIGDMNEAAMLTRPPLVRNPMPPPLYTPGAPAAHNRFGYRNPYAQIGVPERAYRSYPNENVTLNMPAPGSPATFYGAVDFDGKYPRNSAAPPKYFDNATGHETNMVFGPGFVGQPMSSMGYAGDPARPNPDSRYGSGTYLPGFYDERTAHPSMYNPALVRGQRLTSSSSLYAFAKDRVYGVDELRRLNEKYNYIDRTGSDLAALSPTRLGRAYYSANELNARFAVTPLSWDIGVPGSSPWLGGSGASGFGLTAPNPATFPTGGPSHPTGTPIALTPNSSPNPAPAGGDHDGSYRALLSNPGLLGPVDINRKLTDYRNQSDRPYGANNYNSTNGARAAADRQVLAKDIFDRLRMVTLGAGPSVPLPAYPGPGIPNPSYDAHRWLAQLAVNMVDYLDDDDYMTAFPWNNTGGPPADGSGNGTPGAKSGWVFGFERPRLEINEVYARVENDPNDPGPQQMPPQPATRPYVAKFWIELHNPLTPANASELGLLSDGGSALLYNSTTSASVYQLVLADLQAQPDLVASENVLGTVAPARVLCTSNFAAQGPNMSHVNVAPNQLDLGGQGYTSRPQNPAGAAPAFFLVATERNLPDDTPTNALQANRVDAALTYTMPPFAVGPAGANEERDKRSPRILLRRLANPHEVPGPNNPYVTVDYFRVDKLMMNNALSADKNGQTPKGKGKGKGLLNQQIEWNQNRAYGKRQPLQAPQFTEPGTVGMGGQSDVEPYSQRPTTAADGTPLAGTNGVSAEYILHTFARHNGIGEDWASAGNRLDLPFQPLVHQDRIALNPIELVHVVATRPHDFTHAFQLVGAAPNQRWGYAANWFDEGLAPTQSTFLFRALDFLRPSPPLEGLALGARVPGRVNVNTMFVPDFLEAVTDAPGSLAGSAAPFGANRFGTGDVSRVWSNLMLTARSPGLGSGKITPNDIPIRGLATDVPTSGMGTPDGLNRTIARPGAFWDPASSPTYQLGTNAGMLQKAELLSKSFNNLTTRSNCFALYATIGYFEVMNEGPYNENNRPILGKEMGVDDGSVARHKFFAVIDRTNLMIENGGSGAPKQGQAPVFLEYQPDVPLPDPGTMPPNVITPDPDLPTIPPAAAEPPVLVGPNTPGARVQIRIPALSQSPAGNTRAATLTGYYDGGTWKMVDVTPVAAPSIVSRAILDVGPKAEPVIIRFPRSGPSYDPSTGTATVILEYGVPGGQFQFPHARGAVIRLINPDPTRPGSVPGNPGHQAGFSYKAPQYAPVVKYAEQLK